MDDELYSKARQILMDKPETGKKALAAQLGIHPPMARRLKERFRGEREGHRADPLYQEFLALKSLHPAWGRQRISRELNILPDIAALMLARHAGATQKGVGVVTTPPPAVGNNKLEDVVNEDRRDMSYRGDRITNLEEFLAFAQVDTRLWEVERHVINKWEVGSAGPEGGILTSPLFQIKVFLRRRLAEEKIGDLLTGMLERFKQAAPVRQPVAYPQRGEGMFELSLMDLHLGKLSWAPETGRHYDPETAEKMFWAALEDLLGKASGCRPEKILFVAGNDYFNTDVMGRTTTAGTPQDDGLTWKQGFIRGRDLLVRAIERLREVAPVHVTCVNGNHDTARVFYLGEVLSAWFGRTPDVTVDNAPTQRKYVHYGRNLIGFTHGNNERHPNLPLLMASEQPQAWANSQHREWHLGHWHIKRHKMFLPVEDQQGVLVRIVPSLCPADSWHSSMGYSGRLAAEAYFWHPKDGCVATFTHSPA
jgi:hypothetical protein